MIKLILTCAILCFNPYTHAVPPDPTSAGNAETGQQESAKVIRSITGFLQWYKTHLHKVNAFPLLAKDSQGFYVIDKKACSSYLGFLNSSNFISANYIATWQTFFDDKAALLKKERIKDDIPEDFDMDFILMTQEPDIVLNNISRLKYNAVSMNSKAALIGVKLPADNSIQYEFDMINGKAGWQIAYISTKNFD